MRIAIVSDSHLRHGQPPLAPRLVEALRGASLILHAGDVADAGGLALFEAIGPPVLAVAGNADDESLRLQLPVFRLVETPAGTIALMHVLPPELCQAQRAVESLLGQVERPLAVVYGHTHCPAVDTVPLQDGRQAWLVNPGSTTRSRGWGHTFALMELDTDGRSRAWIEKLG